MNDTPENSVIIETRNDDVYGEHHVAKFYFAPIFEPLGEIQEDTDEAV